MANPASVACATDTWTKVASAVTSGQVRIETSGPNYYLVVFRVSGDPAPVNFDGAQQMKYGKPEVISAKEQIDVYIYPKGAAGQVGVDL